MGNIKVSIRKCIFISVMSISTIFFWVAAYCTRGETIKGILFDDRNDTFMDFFKPASWGALPYENMGSYPPMANLINVITAHIANNGVLSEPFGVRNTQIGITFFFLYMILLLFFFCVGINELHGGNKVERYITVLLLLFSAPVIFEVERGNIILLAFVCTLWFVLLYKSPKKYIRYVGYFLLCIASAIKIYPAVFGWIILAEKRTKETVSVVLMGIATFFLPFVFFKNGIRLFILNMKEFTTAGYKYTFGWRINIQTTIQYIGKLLEKDFTILSHIIWLAWVLLTVVFLISKINKIGWREIALLVFVMMLFPSISYTYAIIFAIIPLVLFLTSDEKDTCFTYIYALLFALMFMLVPSSKPIIQHSGSYAMYISSILEAVAILLFPFVIFIEEVYFKYINREKNNLSE